MARCVCQVFIYNDSLSVRMPVMYIKRERVPGHRVGLPWNGPGVEGGSSKLVGEVLFFLGFVCGSTEFMPAL